MVKKCRNRIYALGILVAFAVILLVIAGTGKANVYAGDDHNGHSGWKDLKDVTGDSFYDHVIEKSGNYYLSEDVDISNGNSMCIHVTGDIDVTLCLNGHGIVASEAVLVTDNGAKVTLTNCDNNKESVMESTKTIIVHRGESLTVNNLTIKETSDSYEAIGVDNGGSLEVVSSKIDSQFRGIELKNAGDIT
ncbi:MAG: hypothetical protein ACI4EV_00865, partial [Lachnospiraceae bacterium]